MSERPRWAAHEDDGVWYCDAHSTYDCRTCDFARAFPAVPPKGPVFWSCDDAAEELIHSDQQDAVESYLDARLEPEMTPAETLAALPKEIEVYGYTRRPLGPHEPDPEMVLEGILERLWEEYGDPHGEYDPETQAMRDAAKVLCDVIRAEYKPWACDRTSTVKVNVEEWVKEYRPDWLEPA